MEIRKVLTLVISLVLAASNETQAQGTAFTYQGKLQVQNSPASGEYDLAFSLFTSSNALSQAVASLTNFNTPLTTDGLFSVTLDFGPGVFNGTNLWLQLAVRTNGSGAFTFLAPLQAITASPYAITAGTVTGPLTGSGAGLTNLNWAAVTNRPSTLAGYGIADGITATNATNLVASYAEPRAANLDLLSSVPLSSIGTMAPGAQANEFRTPPMGFITWCGSATSVNELNAIYVMSNMVHNGMAAAGYTYYNLDDGWAGPRDTNGNITVTLTNGTFYPQTPMQYVTNVFPHGLAYIADYAHSNGMKFGIYTVVGQKTCAGYTGSAGHIQQDVSTYASWGVDYIKVETCSPPLTNDLLGQELGADDTWGYVRSEYEAMANAIQNTYRPIFLNVSWWWNMQPWLPSEVNSWRGAGDAYGVGSRAVAYPNDLYHFDFIAHFSYMTGPGHFVDPDVILNASMQTQDQLRSIFSAYAMMSAPLFLGDAGANLLIVTNAGMISIDQDPLVMPAHLAATNAVNTNVWVSADGLFTWPQGANQQVWIKNLQVANGPKKAVLFLNRAYNPAVMNVNWLDVGIPVGISASVYDCWTNAYAGNFVSNYSTTVPAQGSVLLIINSGSSMPLPALGQTFLSDLGWLTTSSCGGVGIVAGMVKDQSYEGGRPISVSGTAYAKGFGAFNPSSLKFNLAGLASRFHSDYGFDDDATPDCQGNFQVWGDGVKLFDSGVVGYGLPHTVDISVAGVTNLTLTTVPVVLGGNDTVDWGNTYVSASLIGDGATLTNLNAANLTGTVSDALLSPNIARLNASQTFTGVNTFNNNVGIGTSSPTQKLQVIGNILASGTITGSSDREVKENFAPVDERAVLAKVATLPITRWNYKADAGVTHLGPMAQDFYAAFALGMDDKHISMVDADGVALAAIQALSRKLDEKDAEITALKERVERLERHSKK